MAPHHGHRASGRISRWSSCPGEVFLEHGLAIRAASPFAETIVAAYNDNTLQYIPTAAAFPEGEYEVDGGWRYIRPGEGERMAAEGPAPHRHARLARHQRGDRPLGRSVRQLERRGDDLRASFMRSSSDSEARWSCQSEIGKSLATSGW